MVEAAPVQCRLERARSCASRKRRQLAPTWALQSGSCSHSRPRSATGANEPGRGRLPDAAGACPGSKRCASPVAPRSPGLAKSRSGYATARGISGYVAAAMSSKPVISLYGLEGLGLVVPYPSGILYTNQTGGTTCAQPVEEGVFVPLGSECRVAEKLIDCFENQIRARLTSADADALDAILHTPDEPSVVTPAFFLEVDRARLDDSMEAWLYVTITACPDEHMIAYAGHADGTFSMVQTLSGRTWNPADQPELKHYVGYPITGFGRRSAILTWPNSD
jgi:hypothetical protein